MKDVVIGINPIVWSNDDLPGVGGDISLETCLSEAAAAGYAGIELGGKFPRNAGQLAPMLENHGLSLISGWYSGRLLQRGVRDEMAELQDHLDLLKRMGCEVLIFAEVSSCIHSNIRARVSQRPNMNAEQWALLARRLSNLAGMTADRGVVLSYHHHMGTVVQSAEDIDRLMEMTGDAVGLLLDTGHAAFAGADPAAIAAKYGSRISHVHCKDVRPAILGQCLNGDSSFLAAVLDGVFTVPGDGCLDFKAVLSALGKADYAGWLVVEAEQDPSVAPPPRYARLGYENLRSILGYSDHSRGL